jgi:DNA damage-binding protein 1
MVYLDNSVVFVGSRLGDSQLIRVLLEPSDNVNSPFVEVIDSFNNLGPIRDLIVINTEGQNQVVTCSGAYKEGSLRIIRSGIGIEEQAEIDLKNVRSLFAFNLNSPMDNYLVVSLTQDTHLLKINDEELEETQIEGFEHDKPTIFAGVLNKSGNLLQITESTINLIGVDGKLITSTKTPVSLCSVNVYSGQILFATRSKLVYMRTDGLTLNVVAEMDFNEDISCIDLAMIGKLI